MKEIEKKNKVKYKERIKLKKVKLFVKTWNNGILMIMKFLIFKFQKKIILKIIFFKMILKQSK